MKKLSFKEIDLELREKVVTQLINHLASMDMIAFNWGARPYDYDHLIGVIAQDGSKEDIGFGGCDRISIKVDIDKYFYSSTDFKLIVSFDIEEMYLERFNHSTTDVTYNKLSGKFAVWENSLFERLIEVLEIKKETNWEVR